MDIIKAENVGYARYEELLLRRDKLRKEAHVLQGLFLKEFGDLITAVFEEKVTCIQKKKTIAFCQASANRGTDVDLNALQDYIQAEMAEYRRRLEDMIADNDAAHKMTAISDADAAKIKKIYRKLAKQLHPDMNPRTEEIPELKTLWNMVSAAYNTNSLEELEEAEVLVNRALKAHSISDVQADIPDLEEKIRKVEEEIRQIKGTDPYCYKYLLDDPALVEEKKRSLQEELKEYQDYSGELDLIMEQLLGKGVKIVWRTN